MAKKRRGEQLPKKPKGAKTILDDGAGLMEVALKESGMDRQKAATFREEAKKKVKPVPSPNAKKWLDKINRSKKVRKDFLDEAENFWRMYQGDYSSRRRRRNSYNWDVISVNFVYSHVETITPSVFSGPPCIRVRPKPKVGESLKEAEVRARSMELVLNYWAKELGLDAELKDVFLDTFFGAATTEMGWETQIDEHKPTAEVPDESSSDEGNGTTTDEVIDEPEVTIIKDRPFIKRVELKHLYLDPDATRRRDCSFIGIEEILRWNDFIASPKFTEKAKKFLKPQYYPKEQEERERDGEREWMGREPNSSDKEWIKIVTIWDKENRKKYVVTQGYSYFLNTDDEDGEDWPYEIDYKEDPFPICIHDAKTDFCSPYTWSEFKAGEPQIREMNRIRAAIQVHVKRSLPKYVYTGAAGSRSKINKLMMARSDEATELDNIDAIKAFETAPIPPQLFEFNSMSRDDLTNVMGTSEYQNNSIADTATEAQIMEGRGQARKSQRSRQWEQYVVEIFAKLAQLCQQNMSEELAVQIAGPNGIEWMTVTPEEIQGEFYYDIEPGIMEYKNEALRKSQLLKFLELTNGDPHANRRALIMKVAQEFDLDPTEVVTPEEEMPQGEPAKPNLKFDNIDPATIQDATVLNALIIAALTQNGVQISPELAAAAQGMPPPPPQPGEPQADLGGAPPTPGDMQAASGKDIAGNGMSPNGNEGMPPVQGNIMDGMGQV